MGRAMRARRGVSRGALLAVLSLCLGLFGPLIGGRVAQAAPEAATFDTPVSYTLTGRPASLASADIDGDGNVDLVVGDAGSARVVVIAGNGDGTLGTISTYPTFGQPFRLVVADFNGDRLPDIASVSGSSNRVSLLLNRGLPHPSTFGAATTPEIGVAGGVAIRAGDFDGNGTIDLAVANGVITNSLSLLPGNGDGTFGTATVFPLGDRRPTDLAVGELNGDGRLDLAVVIQGGVVVLRGVGDGTVAEGASYALPTAYVATVDELDGDGVADLVVSNRSVANDGSNTVGVLRGVGDGTFGPVATFQADPDTVALAVGDLNGDGAPDVAAANFAYGNGNVLLGVGDGTLTGLSTPFTRAQVGALSAVAIVDLNKDGRPDLVALDQVTQSTDAVLVALNTTAADTTPPDTTLAVAPVTGPDATITFAGTDNRTVSNRLRFACSLDGGQFAPCASPQTYRGLSNGPHTILVRATDVASNVDPTPATTTWTVDAIAPTVTIEQAPDQADPAIGSPIRLAVAFSEPVTGLDASDLILAGTAGGTLAATVTGNGTTYEVSVSGMTTPGTVSAAIRPGAAVDAVGNASLASTSVDNTVTYQPPAPSPSPSPSSSPTPTPSPSGPPPSFADVPGDYWAHDQIIQLARRGITTGCDTDAQGIRSYCPERPVTRAEMAAFLIRTLTGTTAAPAGPATPTFSDVPTTHPQYGFIEALVARGITTGCGGTEYCPDREVTRAETAAFTIRALTGSTAAPAGPATPTFSDVPTSHPQYGYIEAMFARGVTTGCGDPNNRPRTYCPGSKVTRAEMAVFIIRAYP